MSQRENTTGILVRELLGHNPNLIVTKIILEARAVRKAAILRLLLSQFFALYLDVDGLACCEDFGLLHRYLVRRYFRGRICGRVGRDSKSLDLKNGLLSAGRSFQDGSGE